MSAAAAGEQAVMAEAMESARQHVNEKTADELGRIERRRLVAIVSIDPIVFPFEGHARLGERDQAAVGDGDAVRVAGTGRPAPPLARQRGAWRRGPIRSCVTV